MDKSGIIKKMMSKKKGKDEDEKGISITAEIETEGDEMEGEDMGMEEEMPEGPIKLMVGDQELEGQELVDYVIENQEEIIKSAEQNADERKQIIESMDY